MPSDNLTQRRIRVNSKEFGEQSKANKAKLLRGEPLREGGEILIVIPAERGKSVSARRRGAMATTRRRRRAAAAAKKDTPKPKPKATAAKTALGTSAARAARSAQDAAMIQETRRVEKEMGVTRGTKPKDEDDEKSEK